jgi:hypothetical protein
MRLIFILCLISTIGFCQENVATGQSIALENFRGAKAIVLIFTSNVCAYDGYYTDRIKTMISQYSSKVQFVLVNSYLEPEEAVDKMKARYDLWAYDVPYVADKNQTWMKRFGARKSPEVFVLDKDLNVIYSGAIDDNPQLAGGVKDNYLKKVLDGASVASTRAVGCSIRSKN